MRTICCLQQRLKASFFQFHQKIKLINIVVKISLRTNKCFLHFLWKDANFSSFVLVPCPSQWLLSPQAFYNIVLILKVKLEHSQHMLFVHTELTCSHTPIQPAHTQTHGFWMYPVSIFSSSCRLLKKKREEESKLHQSLMWEFVWNGFYRALKVFLLVLPKLQTQSKTIKVYCVLCKMKIKTNQWFANLIYSQWNIEISNGKTSVFFPFLLKSKFIFFATGI